uniref:Uncharacterized protein n=1 Tax=uncultured Nocardioidaceae bacterium TaxID=253824 RepID=A0A6J4MHK7_9ACTN|nr:MAG: hypothetical protein AVDCRST_MAG46-3160 [uncultured Nocardioidaceae bacterium]
MRISDVGGADGVIGTTHVVSSAAGWHVLVEPADHRPNR